jgi:hypothetical protein
VRLRAMLVELDLGLHFQQLHLKGHDGVQGGDD